MNLIEALKAGKYVRRPIPKHLGSGRTGWLSNEWVISKLIGSKDVGLYSNEYLLINEVDFLANDWEASNTGKK